MSAILLTLERVAGIEPAYSAWKADVLPLNYTRCVIRSFHPSAGGGGLFGATPLSLRYNMYSLHHLLRKTQLYNYLGGGGWIRTTEARASDLQSDPFGHSGTPPKGGILSGWAGTLSTASSNKIINLRRINARCQQWGSSAAYYACQPRLQPPKRGLSGALALLTQGPYTGSSTAHSSEPDDHPPLWPPPRRD